MADQHLELEIRQIESGDRLTGLSLGADFTPLKTFLQKHAKTFHRQHLARTYACFSPQKAASAKVCAYITLVCGEVVTDGDDKIVADVEYHYNQYPAVKIARLAVDKRFRGLQVGRQLVDLALGIATETICPAVGCRFVVVDAKRASVGFYNSCGFTMLDTPANRERQEPVMFVDLHKSADAI